jgi:hypothetical protein
MDPVRATKNADVLVGFKRKAPIITKPMVKQMRPKGLLVDAGIGTIRPDALAYAHAHGMKVYRLDMRAGLSGEILMALETRELLNSIAGETKVRGVLVVAGGLIGKVGTVVVDSILGPTRVIGVADGQGHLIKDKKRLKQYEDRVSKVRAWIAERLLE